jgi:hypothetical protein
MWLDDLWGELFVNNGTSYALIAAAIIGTIYLNQTLIDFGTTNSAFRLNMSVMIPFMLVAGTGLLMHKIWLLKLAGAGMVFMALHQISYVLATLHPLGKF